MPYSTLNNVVGGEPLSMFQTVYTKELLLKMNPVLRYPEFATVRTDLAVQPGKSISFPRLSLMKGDAELTELTDIVVEAMEDPGPVEIPVREYGRGVGVSRLALITSFRSVLDDATALLAMSAAWSLNYSIMKAVTWTPNVLYATGDSRDDLTEKSTMSAKLVKDAVELLSTNNTPKFVAPTPIAGVTDFFIGFATPHQLRGLRDDPEWISAAHYGAPGQIFAGEVGMFEKVRFIETNMQPIISKSTGKILVDQKEVGTDNSPGSVDVHKAVIFGANAVGWAIAHDVEIRLGAEKDFGRKVEIAWYAVWGFGRIDEDYSVSLETA